MLVAQTEPLVELYGRTQSGWAYERLTGLDAVLQLPLIGVELPLSEIYEDVRLTGQPSIMGYLLVADGEI